MKNKPQVMSIAQLENASCMENFAEVMQMRSVAGILSVSMTRAALMLASVCQASILKRQSSAVASHTSDVVSTSHVSRRKTQKSMVLVFVEDPNGFKNKQQQNAPISVASTTNQYVVAMVQFI
jgi:hypothetical protein